MASELQFLMGVRHTVCACMHACPKEAENSSKREAGSLGGVYSLLFQPGQGSCEDRIRDFLFE